MIAYLFSENGVKTILVSEWRPKWYEPIPSPFRMLSLLSSEGPDNRLFAPASRVYRWYFDHPLGSAYFEVKS